jgi:hypothetical protein
MIDWRARGGEFHRIELPAFPGVLLPAVFLRGDGKLYFPIVHVCAALDVRDNRQREKVKRDYPESVNRLVIPTTKGDQSTLCVEWEALGAWLITIQEERTGDAQRGRLRTFKRQVWHAASEILMGRHEPVALPAPDGRRGEIAGLHSLALQTEQRVGRIERVVFVGDPEDSETISGDSRTARCPHCGGALRVTVGTLQIAPGEE